MNEANMFARVVVSGDVVEVYEYSRSIVVGKKRDYAVSRCLPDDEKKQKREDNLKRSRQTIRRLIWANQGDYTKFITLTYAETELDVKKVLRDLRTFVQRMRRNGYTMQYVYVLENQKARGEKEGNDGCLHIHMLLFNDEFLPLDLLRTCWPHGYVSIEKIDHVNNVGAYVCKYLTKQGLEFFNRHAYGCSRGLKRPKDERFYLEGFSDTTTGLHPFKILNSMQIDYTETSFHDYQDKAGVWREQGITYYRGKFIGENLIEKYKDDFD